MKKDKATKAIKATEVTDSNKATMSDKEMGMFILNKSIDMAMDLEKNAPTLQSADEPSLIDNRQKSQQVSD